MSWDSEFDERNRRAVRGMSEDRELIESSRRWLVDGLKHEYSYHFEWLGVPIIQYPQDIVVTQELIWKVRPDLVVETGIARGGSLILSASILELLGGDGMVVGVDIDIREPNRRVIEAHPVSHRITMIEGSSVAPDVVARVHELARDRERVIVFLDSDHTHPHVLAELEAYSPLVRPGSYVVVFDTIIDDLPDASWEGRSWGPDNNPKTAVRQFLEKTDRFRTDTELEAKLLITVAPGGFLECVKEPSG
jgi:cephalosporin hydroxylase